ncbi:MAG: phosphomannomutase/phosphoglucomutase [Clostridia bacterium]|nr:phosphomannomutase/phosphoglucomutase [Clostridia bacterium]
MSIYKDCDIRGIYPTELDEASAHAVGRALATLHPGAAVAVGGDVRLSTPTLKAALIQGLAESGARVTDIGTVPTPALYFAIRRLGLDGGMTVTASHNPAQYNGIKFIFGEAPVNRAIMDEVQAAVASGQFPDAQGTLARVDILPAYIEARAARFQAARPLKIVVDAGNGAMSVAAPQVFRRCGFRVTQLFCEPDGTFPNRGPDPSDYRSLGALRAQVREAEADFGVAFDGDGDRAVFVDERGEVVINEKSMVLFVRHLLKDCPTPVVYDQKSSSIIRRAVLEMGGAPVPERSGHTYVKRRFLDVGAALAGEVSGHFFFGELGYDDGLYAALVMADLLAHSDQTLSRLAADIPCPPITPDLRMSCPYGEQQDWLDRIEALAEGRDCEVSRLDGVRLDFADGWIMLRKSVTAEQMTLRAEAETEPRLRQLLELAAAALPESAQRVILNT